MAKAPLVTVRSRINVVIYHAPNYISPNGRRGKVGCTRDLEARKRQYEMGRGIKVLETLRGVTPKQAGDREFWWAKKFKYKRKGWPYKVITNGAAGAGHNFRDFTAKQKLLYGSLGGRRCGELGKSGFKHFTRKQRLRYASAGGRIGGVSATSKIYRCSCGKIGKGPAMLGWHIKTCRGKK